MLNPKWGISVNPFTTKAHETLCKRRQKECKSQWIVRSAVRYCFLGTRELTAAGVPAQGQVRQISGLDG